jgi:hypothetical protein
LSTAIQKVPTGIGLYFVGKGIHVFRSLEFAEDSCERQKQLVQFSATADNAPSRRPTPARSRREGDVLAGMRRS